MSSCTNEFTVGLARSGRELGPQQLYITALHLRHGGVELAITQLANALVQRGHQVSIFCTYNLGEPAYRLDPRVRVHYLTDCRPNRESFREAVAARRPSAIVREGARAVRTLWLKRKTMIRAIRRVHPGDGVAVLSTRHEHAKLLVRYGRAGVRRLHWMHHDHNWQPKLIREIRRDYGRLDDFIVLDCPGDFEKHPDCGPR